MDSRMIRTSRIVTCSLLLLLFFLVPGSLVRLAAQTPEICDNQIDDDGDGAIDCLDLDCQPGVFEMLGIPLPSGTDLSLGDLDGDGDLDGYLATATGSDHNLFNDGSGNFNSSGQTLADGHSAAVALGDIDGDGDLDAWVARKPLTGSTSAHSHIVWINDGLGNFSTTGQTLLTSDHGTDVALGDIDGDGDLDACVTSDTSTSKIWINEGLGQFTPGPFPLGTELQSTSITLGDVDGDLDLDVVIASSDPANRVLLNNGLGQFTTATYFGGGLDGSIALGDLDADGDLDAWQANQQATAAERVYLNDGFGSFAVSIPVLEFSSQHDVALGDYDFDGDLDAIVIDLSSQNRVLLNDGSGNFTDSGHSLGAAVGSNQRITCGDVDGDGDLDAVVIDESQQSQVWINRGTYVCWDVDNDGIVQGCDIDYTAGIDCDGDGSDDS